MSNKKNTIAKDQSGLVSIIVTMIMMIVLTLIVISFSRLSRREQRLALDRQLSSQAFYAAESGINDVNAALSNTAYGLPASRNDCNDPWPASALATNGGTINPNIDPASGIEYTCVLYDDSPPQLDYTAVPTDNVVIIPISNDNLTKLSFSWEGSSNIGPSPFRPPGNTFTSQSTWDSNAGVLRVNIIPRTTLVRDFYKAATVTSFLYPETGGAGTVQFGTSRGVTNSGTIVGGNCAIGNSPRACTVDVEDLEFGNSGYVIVLRSIYHANAVTIRGYDGGGAQVDLQGAQATIDVTGKANDVLRRIKVNVPINETPENLLPLGLTSIEDLCKQIIVDPRNAPFITGLGSC